MEWADIKIIILITTTVSMVVGFLIGRLSKKPVKSKWLKQNIENGSLDDYSEMDDNQTFA